MAVVRRAWQFPLVGARAALDEMRSISDVLDRSVGERAELARSHESCSDILVLARLSPDDDETWDRILHPRIDDFGFEQAAAGRLTAVLADLSEGLGAGGRVPPLFLEATLLRAGRADWDVGTLLRGRRLPTLLREEELVPGELVDRCEPWLPGGWLSAEAARSWASQLLAESSRLDRVIVEAAEHLAPQAHVSPEGLTSDLREGLDNLSAAYSRASGIVWILQD